MSEENQDSVESESPPRKYANKYESPEDLESAYNSLNKKFSSTLRVPDSGATPDEWEKFWGKMGRPETPHGYSMPENEQQRQVLDPNGS